MPNTTALAKELRQLLERRKQMQDEVDDATRTIEYRNMVEDEITDIHNRIGDLFNLHGLTLLDHIESVENQFKEADQEVQELERRLGIREPRPQS